MNTELRHPAGTLLAGKFRVLGLLGQGGMGTVYEVEHERIKKRRALKVLHASEQRSMETVERFRREATVGGRIRNAHIVEAFDAGELETGELYVEMEYLVGETLAARIQRQGPLEFEELIEMMGQACQGVQAAHDAGIVHRDLKPANIMITERDGRPFIKLLDFGISRFEPNEGESMERTSKGVILGSPCYMPPEQIRGQMELVDARSDVFALGVILYACAAGRLPFRADQRRLLELLICEGKYEALRGLRPDLPEGFCDVVAQAMAVDREQRISSARKLGERLNRFRNTGEVERKEPEELDRPEDSRELLATKTERIEDINMARLARRPVPKSLPLPEEAVSPADARKKRGTGRNWVVGMAMLGIIGGVFGGITLLGLFHASNPALHLKYDRAPLPRIPRPISDVKPEEPPPTLPPKVIEPAQLKVTSPAPAGSTSSFQTSAHKPPILR